MDVVIHGHFYQPPRTSPWTGQVPRQESAHPSHDWNERITAECYRPNARSRVMGAGNRIEDIVNNYAYMSFDFGPTLLTYLAAHAPGVYARILEGDRRSQRLCVGHGNAIAHAYNHTILPLDEELDRRTQITWGLRDFEHRFGRPSESLWLPETAVSRETIRTLITSGIRYIVLAPHQAQRVRPIGRGSKWVDVSDGSIDPRRPYRYFLRDPAGADASESPGGRKVGSGAPRGDRPDQGYIDIFFYNGRLAADISFGHLLRSAPSLAERLAQAGRSGAAGEGLVSVATDGEVYGHHEPFADMCFSYLVRREAPGRGFRLTNYGEYLERHPPRDEVELEFGEWDEGSAWSCAHGVGRWQRDCGCSTGGRPGWNQAWRTPLRAAFDLLREQLVTCFLTATVPLLKDPWKARDDYISVLLDPSSTTRDAFLERHARQRLMAEDRQGIWRLLESQRYAMFTYTSCGWFFADISGLEAVQNLAHAARAIDLAQPWLPEDVEERMLAQLAEGRSNLPEMGTGADVYRRFVRPQRLRPQVVAGEAALRAAVTGGPLSGDLFRYRLRSPLRAEQRLVRQGATESNPHQDVHERLALVDCETEEVLPFAVHLFDAGTAAVRCYVVPLAESDNGAAPASTDRAAPEPEERALLDTPGVDCVTLQDLVSEDREQVIRAAHRAVLARQEELLERLFDDSSDLIRTFRSSGIPLPPILAAMARSVLARRLRAVADRLPPALESGGEERRAILAEAAGLLRFARDQGVELSAVPLADAYGRVLTVLLRNLVDRFEPATAERCAEIIRSSHPLHFALDRRPLEDLAFQAFHDHRKPLRELAARGGEDGDWRAYAALADALHLNIERILAIEEHAAG